jgi:hypothetical protein
MLAGRTRGWAALGIAAVCALSALWLSSRNDERAGGSASQSLRPHAPLELDGPRSSGAKPGSDAPPAAASSSAAPRRARGAGVRPITAEALAQRQRILDALDGARSPGPRASTPGDGAEHPKAGAAPGTMADRTGQLGPEVRVLNQDFLPLVDECYAQSRERDPNLSGMLALNVKFASAEGIGAIIEDVEPGPGNELDEEELIECVRQSAYSIELPKPRASGTSAVYLTIPLEAAQDAGARRPR